MQQGSRVGDAVNKTRKARISSMVCRAKKASPERRGAGFEEA